MVQNSYHRRSFRNPQICRSNLHRRHARQQVPEENSFMEVIVPTILS
jgi:hypothetical protein